MQSNLSYSAGMLSHSIDWQMCDYQGRGLLVLIAAWINNHMLGKVWGETNYALPHFKGEVREWMISFMTHCIMDEMYYPY